MKIWFNKTLKNFILTKSREFEVENMDSMSAFIFYYCAFPVKPSTTVKGDSNTSLQEKEAEGFFPRGMLLWIVGFILLTQC